MKFQITMDYKVPRHFPQDEKNLKRWLADEIAKSVRGTGKANVSVVSPEVTKAEPKPVVKAQPVKPAVVKKKKNQFYKGYPMSVPVIVGGVTYTIPNTGNEAWGADVTNWIVAITAQALQKTGGTYSLTAELDLGASFGIKSIYYKSRSADIADTGILRLANTDVVSWRNDANDGNLDLVPDATNEQILAFGTSEALMNDQAQTFTLKTMDDALTAQDIATPSTPATNYNKLYFKAGELTQLDDAGVETSLFPAGSNFNTFDTTYSSDPTGTVAHGLGASPDFIMVSYEDVASSGQFKPLVAQNYVRFDGTNLYLDFSGLGTIDGTQRLIVNAVRFV